MQRWKLLNLPKDRNQRNAKNNRAVSESSLKVDPDSQSERLFDIHHNFLGDWWEIKLVKTWKE